MDFFSSSFNVQKRKENEIILGFGTAHVDV